MEDMILSDYIRTHGDGGWKNIPKRAGLKRCGKSCRLRWLNYLRPDIKRGNISPDEEELIIRLHRLLGNRWSLIAGRLPGRTDNEIKNYWNTHVSKKLRLSTNESLQKMSQNISPTSKSPFPLQNRVFKATAVKITTAVRISEAVRSNGCIDDDRNNRVSQEVSKLCNVKENTKCSWQDLVVNDSIGDEESERIGFAMVDNLVETAGTISTSSMSCLPDPQSAHYDQVAKDAATLPDKLLSSNDLFLPECNLLLHSPSDCSTDFVSEEFYRGIEELYDNAQHGDWIHEFDYL